MDFLPTAPHEVPRNTYPCLVKITVGGTTGSRRGSQGSQGGSDKDDNTLQRIMSGSRRKSVQLGPGAVASGAHAPFADGTWYWRGRVGVTENTLVILPLSNPANPVLNQRPAPLSHAMHFTHPTAAGGHAANGAHHEEGLGSKLMGAVRRASAGFIHKPEHNEPAHQQHEPAITGTTGATGTTGTTGGVGTTSTSTDATVGGSTASNATAVPHEQATHDTNKLATETGWPGHVEGQALHAIVVPLHYLHKDRMAMRGNDKTGFYLDVNVGSAISGKSGALVFEFDKDWLGAKGECELLFNALEMGVQNAAPVFTSVQLSGKP